MCSIKIILHLLQTFCLHFVSKSNTLKVLYCMMQVELSMVIVYVITETLLLVLNVIDQTNKIYLFLTA